MALSLAQSGDSGAAAIASGAAGTIFSSNTTVGNCVALAIINTNNSVNNITSVTSSIGTFVQVASPTGGTNTAFDTEWWVCTAATGAAKTVTVTSSGAHTWLAQATEWSGGVGAAQAILITTGTSTSASVVATPTIAGQVVLGIGNSPNRGFATGPAAPWTVYGAGGFTLASGWSVAWQVTPTTSTVAAQWTLASDKWLTLGCVLTPAPAVAFVGSPSFIDLDTHTTYNLIKTGVTPGNPLMLHHISANPTAGIVASVSGGGATWSKATGASVSAAGDIEIWLGVGGNAASVNVSVVCAGSSTCGGQLFELANCNVTTPLESSSHTTGAGITMTSASVSPTTTGDMVFAAAFGSSTLTSVPASPFSVFPLFPTYDSGVGSASGDAAWLTGVANTIYKASWTIGSNNWDAVAVVIALAVVPSVTSITPNSGPTAGGTSVVIAGVGLTGATVVKFGTKNAASFVVNSDTKITATSPAQ